jgi:hypothetical protein
VFTISEVVLLHASVTLYGQLPLPTYLRCAGSELYTAVPVCAVLKLQPQIGVPPHDWSHVSALQPGLMHPLPPQAARSDISPYSFMLT